MGWHKSAFVVCCCSYQSSHTVGNTSLLVNNVPVRVGGLIGNATTDKDGLMSRNDKKSMPQRLALSPLKITGLESGRGFFCEIVAKNYECGLYYIYRTDSNVYYYLITGVLTISSIKIKDDAIYITRDGVVFNITCLHGNDIKLDYSTVVPDDAIQGIKK